MAVSATGVLRKSGKPHANVTRLAKRVADATHQPIKTCFTHPTLDP
jgi:hypothetical protein